MTRFLPGDLCRACGLARRVPGQRLCAGCGRPRDEGERTRLHVRRAGWRGRGMRPKKGQCIRCTAPPASGSVHCEMHLQTLAELARERGSNEEDRDG